MLSVALRASALALLVASNFGATPRIAAQVTASAERLQVGKLIEREMKGGETHAYTVALTTGELLDVVVDQKGIDVVVTITGPDGRKPLEADSPHGPLGQEVVWFVAEAAGEHRIEIRSLDTGRPHGRYVLGPCTLRPASESDRMRAQAILEAVSLRKQVDALYQAEEFRQAIPLAERAAALEESLGSREPLDLAYAIHNVAGLYASVGQYAPAEPLALRALSLYEKALGPDHWGLAMPLNTVAALLSEQGRNEKAEPFLVRVLELREKTLGPDHPDFGMSLNNLGTLYIRMGRLEDAKPLFARSLEIFERLLGPENPNLYYPFLNLGRLYLESNSGEPGEVERLFARALAIAEKTWGAESLNTASVTANLGWVHWNAGELGKAEACFSKALGIYERRLGPDHRDVCVVLRELGGVIAAAGRTTDAIRRFAHLSDMRERDLTRNLAAGSEQAKLDYLEITNGDMSQSISLHMYEAPEDPAAMRVAVESVLRRKGRILDEVTDQIAALRRNAPPDDQQLFDELASARARLSEFVLRGPEAAPNGEYRKTRDELESKIDRVEGQLSSRSSRYRAQLSPVTLDAVRKEIPAHTALIEIARFTPVEFVKSHPRTVYKQPRYVAYVLFPTGDVRWADLGDASLVDDLVKQASMALRDPRRGDSRAATRQLYDRVMRPIRPLLGRATHLLISPDSLLHLVPFAALLDEHDRYLVERYAICHVSSGRDLVRRGGLRDSSSASLIVAAPDFGQTAEGAPVAATRATDISRVRFRTLSTAELEAREVAQLIGESAILTGTRATETSLKQCAAPRVLHIATHGFFFDEASLESVDTPSPTNWLLRSGLALAGANRRDGGNGEDGILTAMEASGLDLWGTKLVVLSACDTGVGGVRTSEGVYGLRRALVLAGSETQVMSLWSVDDRATRDLMVAYYKELLSGAGRAEAMQRVQRALLKDPKRRHPSYWAAFIVSGDWRPLD
jgi:CHAT domain-containing protein/tetratricopeptide (TPR) repeat protein